MTETLVGCRLLLGNAWRQNPRRFVVAIVLMVCGSVAAPLAALSARWLVDAAVAGDTRSAVFAGVSGAFLAVAALTFSNFAHLGYFELAEMSMLDFECQLIELSNGSPGIAHHEDPDFADKLIVVRQGLRRLRAALESVLALVSLALTVAVTGVLLARLSVFLLLLILLAVPPLVCGRWAERIEDRAKVATAEQSRIALGLFRLATDAAASKEIRVLRMQDEVIRRHREHWGRVSRVLWSAYRSSTAVRGAGQLVLAAGYLGGVLLVVRAAVQGHRTVGDVVLAIALATQVNTQIANAASLLVELQTLGRTMAHLKDIRTAVTMTEPGRPLHRPPARLTRGIELAGVSFAYPGSDRPVLRDVTVTLPAGATVAIVGENGAGKSTLVKLLARLHEPTAGRITVDGRDLADIALPRWRERTTVGFQDFVRFELTAQEAVGIGDLPAIASPDAAMAALERAQSGDVVRDLPDGLASHLGRQYTDGAQLSGGQWQRIALGRSFMREQPLLVILDEPTAALDAETEHLLFERYAAAAGRTAARTGAITVLISHRFSTVRMADVILVLADGRVSEMGDHDTLIAAGGLYAELFAMQARAYR